MQKRGPAVFFCLLLIAASNGCGSKGNSEAAGQGKAGDDEAQLVAEKFGDLLISKCAGGYMFAGGKPTVFAKPFEVKAEGSAITDTHSEGYFYGYDWTGHVEIMRDGEGMSYGIYKRSGQWFYRSRGESDVSIDALRSIRPECPK